MDGEYFQNYGGMEQCINLWCALIIHFPCFSLTAIRPPFLKGKANLDYPDEQRGKIIAAARVHVERFNQRIKNWKFIKDTIPHYNFPLMSQAIYVICHLANLTPMILKK